MSTRATSRHRGQTEHPSQLRACVVQSTMQNTVPKYLHEPTHAGHSAVSSPLCSGALHTHRPPDGSPDRRALAHCPQQPSKRGAYPMRRSAKNQATLGYHAPSFSLSLLLRARANARVREKKSRSETRGFSHQGPAGDHWRPCTPSGPAAAYLEPRICRSHPAHRVSFDPGAAGRLAPTPTSG